MGKLPDDIADFMETYGVSASELWEVRNGAYAIKHKALERVAASRSIVFDPPQVIEANGGDKIAAICVTGRMGERVEWSIGEASPANNKNAYCYAMAEKRGKDRVILKLLNAYGALYSEDEADEFRQNGGTLAKKDAKDIYTKMQAEVRQCISIEQLRTWMDGNKERIGILPDDWQDTLRLQCQEMLADLRQREVA